MAEGAPSRKLAIYAPGRLVLAGARRPGAVLLPGRKFFDTRFGGRSRLSGTTAVASSPDVMVSCRVRLYHERNGSFCAREMWSSDAGNYSFLAIDIGPWVVIALDHTGEYNAVVASGRYGDPM